MFNYISKFSKTSLVRFHQEEVAATAVEYAVMLMCIALICMKSIQLAGFHIGEIWGDNANDVGQAMNN